LFAQIISQLQHHDIQQSKMLSNELSQVRKTMKTVSQLKLSLDQVHMRLESTLDIGDAMAALKPAVGTLYSVKTGLTGVMPNVDLELSEINSVFGDIMLNAESAGEISLALGQGGDDVRGIISEAHAIAEQRVNDSFPDIPSNTFGNTRTTLGEHPQ
jgi:division protein CdvB (Snf7/Vps24/ESCRT-III family)